MAEAFCLRDCHLVIQFEIIKSLLHFQFDLDVLRLRCFESHFYKELSHYVSDKCSVHDVTTVSL